MTPCAFAGIPPGVGRVFSGTCGNVVTPADC
jgi:hypothetical protein